MWRAVLVAAMGIGVAATASGAAAQVGGGTVRAVLLSSKVVVGQTSQVGLGAWDIPSPDTIAYSVTMHFDTDLLKTSSCTSDANDPDSTCERPDEGTFIFSSTSGEVPIKSNTWKLGLVGLTCTRAGVSTVTVTISSWQSSMLEAPPQPDVQDGTVTCVSDLPTLSVQSATGVVGEDVAVNILVSHMPEPGLGTWTVDVDHDPAKVRLVGCVSRTGGVCGPHYSATLDRITGATTAGIVGDFTLATMYYRCLGPGSAPLSLTTNVFADATPGNPQNVVAEIQNGTITCVAPTPTTLPAATSTPASAALPPAGGGDGQQPIAPWLPIALVSLGAGAMALGGAWLRRRA